MIKKGSTTKIPKGIVKVMRGSSLVWKKNVGGTISFKATEIIYNWSTDINIPENIHKILKGKELLELNVGGYRIKKGDFYLSGFVPKFNLSKSMMDLTGLKNSLNAGTTITVTYK